MDPNIPPEVPWWISLVIVVIGIPAVGGVGVFIKSIFGQMIEERKQERLARTEVDKEERSLRREEHAAYIADLKQQREEDTRERFARESAWVDERNAWLQHLSNQDDSFRDHNKISAELARRLEMVELTITELLQWLKKENGKHIEKGETK